MKKDIVMTKKGAGTIISHPTKVEEYLRKGWEIVTNKPSSKKKGKDDGNS